MSLPLDLLDPETAHLLRGAVNPEEFHYRMRADPRFAAEIGYHCAAGIPRSVFLGRVVREGEPAWTAYDRDVAVAYQHWRSQLCSGCGLHPLDWRSERDEPFEVEVRTCFSCRAIEAARSEIPEERRHDRSIQTVLVSRDPLQDLDDDDELLTDEEKRARADQRRLDDLPGLA